MNQQCKVCGEPAAGFHFGAFTCEGCKSFFGRTNNNQSAITECKNNGECVINKKNRTSCKACRLKKCLMVGMSKSSSRYGRRSNWFKIHCLMEEQTNRGGLLPLGSNPAAGTSPFFGAGLYPPGLFYPPEHHHHLGEAKPRVSKSTTGDECGRLSESSAEDSAASSEDIRLLRRPAFDIVVPPLHPAAARGPCAVPMLGSPALGGVAEEQDQPIDLSLHSTQEEVEPKRRREASPVAATPTPLDLTAGRARVSPLG